MAKKTLTIPYTNCIFDALELLMKHSILFFALLMCSISGYAQTKNINISWDNDTSRPSFVAPSSALVNSKAVKQSSKQRSSERLKLTLTKQTIDFSEQWKDRGFANPSTLKVGNVAYSAVTSKELAQVSVRELEDALEHLAKPRELEEQLDRLG